MQQLCSARATVDEDLVTPPRGRHRPICKLTVPNPALAGSQNVLQCELERKRRRMGPRTQVGNESELPTGLPRRRLGRSLITSGHDLLAWLVWHG